MLNYLKVEHLYLTDCKDVIFALASFIGFGCRLFMFWLLDDVGYGGGGFLGNNLLFFSIRGSIFYFNKKTIFINYFHYYNFNIMFELSNTLLI